MIKNKRKLNTFFQLFSKLNFNEKVYFIVRFLTAPFLALEKLVFSKGDILDYGCGTGIFSLLLIIKEKKRRVFGVDPDINKIKTAQKIKEKNTNFQVLTKSFFKQGKKFDSIIISDVLYLLDEQQKIILLKSLAKMLKKNGQIIIKTNDKNYSIGYFLCYFQEVISVLLTSNTYSKHKDLYFLSLEEYRALFKKTGLYIKQAKRLHTLFFHPHFAFVLKKRNNL